LAANRLGLEASAENWRAATDLAERSRRNSFQQVANVLVGLSEKEQLAFLAHQDDWLLHTVLSLPLSPSDDERLPDLSAGWLINGKAVAQQALASRALLSRDESNPKVAKTVQELTAVRQELAALALKAAKPGEEAARQARIEQLTSAEQRLSRELAAANGQAPPLREWVTVDALRRALPDDAIYIDIMRFQRRDFQVALGKDRRTTPPHYVAWIIPPAGHGDVKIVDLGTAKTIDGAVHQARRSVAAVTDKDGVLKREGEAPAEALARKDLARVAELVWKPLSAHAAEATKLIVSPDGVLWLAPWAALPVDDDRYLVEQFSISFVNSGRDILNDARTTAATNKPAIFANPDYDLTSDAVRAATKAVFPNFKFDANQTRGLAFQSALPKVLRLPFTAIEEQAARPSIEALTGSAPLAYTDRYALESIAKRVQRPKLLLFATHGFFLPDQEVRPNTNPQLADNDTRNVALSASGKPLQNPLLRCGLLLAGCNAPQAAGGDDGILTGMEIVGLDLRGTDLVVLSACETGLGQLQYGEGVAGLRQAFQLAGAKSVVSTLWTVPDRDSTLIMSEFFANIAAGQSNADALRNAQLKRINSRRERYGAAHPFFWAAWTVTGN
jgi:CHAT domain-containing protein